MKQKFKIVGLSCPKEEGVTLPYTFEINVPLSVIQSSETMDADVLRYIQKEIETTFKVKNYDWVQQIELISQNRIYALLSNKKYPLDSIDYFSQGDFAFIAQMRADCEQLNTDGILNSLNFWFNYEITTMIEAVTFFKERYYKKYQSFYQFNKKENFVNVISFDHEFEKSLTVLSEIPISELDRSEFSDGSYQTVQTLLSIK